LSVACGHCVELNQSSLFSTNRSYEFIALDQDKYSCEYVRGKYGAHAKIFNQSIRALLRSDEGFGQFDLIFATGLYDYLSDQTAFSLTQTLARMLRPGGKLLFGNFRKDCVGRGYMDLFMDWRLIYRSGADLQRIAGNCPNQAVQYFTDPHGNVDYVLLKRPS
jgi:SAM-dependent methyltransferase